jgi:exonuclease III
MGSNGNGNRLHMVSCNMAGFNKKKTRLAACVKEERIDVILLQETLSTGGILFPGYQFFEITGVRKSNNQGYKWGVATLVRNDLLVKQLDVRAKINHPVVRVRVTVARETVEVYTVYNPGGTRVNLGAWLLQADPRRSPDNCWRFQYTPLIVGKQ